MKADSNTLDDGSYEKAIIENNSVVSDWAANLEIGVKCDQVCINEFKPQNKVVGNLKNDWEQKSADDDRHMLVMHFENLSNRCSLEVSDKRGDFFCLFRNEVLVVTATVNLRWGQNFQHYSLDVWGTLKSREDNN